MKKFLEALWTNFKDNVTLIWKDFKSIDEPLQNNMQHYDARDALNILILVCGSGYTLMGFLGGHFPTLLFGVIQLIIFSLYNMKNKR